MSANAVVTPCNGKSMGCHIVSYVTGGLSSVAVAKLYEFMTQMIV